MIDTDVLNLPVISHYFVESYQGVGRAQAFFSQSVTLSSGQVSTYHDLLILCVKFHGDFLA